MFSPERPRTDRANRRAINKTLGYSCRFEHNSRTDMYDAKSNTFVVTRSPAHVYYVGHSTVSKARRRYPGCKIKLAVIENEELKTFNVDQYGYIAKEELISRPLLEACCVLLLVCASLLVL